MKIGIDMCEVHRFKKFDFSGAFAVRIFTQEELKECKKKAHPEESLAVRFAAKEAIQKTLPKPIRYNLIEITTDSSGRPGVRLLDPQFSDAYNVEVSLSHTVDFVVAACITVEQKNEDQ